MSDPLDEIPARTDGLLARWIPMSLQLVLFVTLLPYLALPGFPAQPLTKEHLLVGTLILLLLASASARQPQVILGLVFADTVVVTFIFATLSTDDAFLPYPYFILVMLALLNHHVRYVAAGVAFPCAGYIAVLFVQKTVTMPHLLMVPVLLLLAALVSCHVFRAEAFASRASRVAQHVSVDVLTGLPNRAAFLDRVWDAIHFARRFEDELFAVLFIDLDGFKPVNDQFGHRAGDELLKAIASRLRLALRKGDCVARYGGDEFCVLLSRVQSKTEAIRAAERLLEKIKAPVSVSGHTVNVGASIGIALSTNIHTRPEELVRDADAAMYRVKQGGKNGVAVSNQLTDYKQPITLRTELAPGE